MKPHSFLSAFAVVVLSCAVARVACADGSQVNDIDDSSVTDSSSNETSPQVLDKRLPAVMPGQEVTVNGNKMNVWTTAGDVPVGQAPEPWKQDPETTKQQLQGAGVIVDQRPRREDRPR